MGVITECKARGCLDAVTGQNPFCNKHWEMLPQSLRDEIMKAKHVSLRAEALQINTAQTWLTKK